MREQARSQLAVIIVRDGVLMEIDPDSALLDQVETYDNVHDQD